MRRLRWLGWLGYGLGSWLLHACAVSTSAPASLASTSPAAPVPAVRYATQVLPQGVAHIVTVPAQSPHLVMPAIAEGTATVEGFAQQTGAIAVLNAGFFDPVNRKTTSHITLNGQLAADPAQNERLVNNPDLSAYLEPILNRSEFRRYQCGSERQYAITRHQDPVPPNCQLVDAIAAGPQLLPTLTREAEAFREVQNGTIVRDAIGSDVPNARSVVGLTPAGDVILVMVAQQEGRTGTGISLPDLADLMRSLGADRALNLDGGSSASLYYQGKAMYGKRDEQGHSVRRAVKSVLLVR